MRRVQVFLSVPFTTAIASMCNLIILSESVITRFGGVKNEY